MFNIDINNRKDLGIDDFEFLLAFKEQWQPVFFRMFLDSTRTFGKNENCLMLDNEEEYGFMRLAFRRYQKKGYGIFFVVNNGGQKVKDITSLTAHFGDVDFGKEKIGVDANGKDIFRYRTIEEIETYKQGFLKDLQHFQLEPSVIVETRNGFHVYWLLEKGTQRLNAFRPIQDCIIRRFNSDPRIVDLNRVLRIPNYFHLKDSNNPFHVKCIKFDPHLRYTQERIAAAFQCDLSDISNSVYEEENDSSKGNMIPDEKDPALIPTEVANVEGLQPQEFGTIEDAVGYLRKQDMARILGITAEPGRAFNCVFHEDQHPSAVIVNNRGSYKYFCNSPACGYHTEKGLDIIDIVSRMKSLSFLDSVTYLCEKLCIDTPRTKWKKSQEQKYPQNMDKLSDRRFMQQYKSLNRLIRFGIRVLVEINQIGLESITFEEFSFGKENVFFFSNRYLSNRLGMNLKQTNKYINMFCALRLIAKVPYKDVPETLLQNAKEIAKSKRQRIINFYTVPHLEEVADKAEDIAREMVERGYSSLKAMSKALMENLFDETVAESIYGRSEASSFSKEVQELIERFLVEEIARKGYVVLDDIYAWQIRIDGEPVKKETRYIAYKRLIPALIDKYDLEYRKANKELRQRFGLEGYSYVLYKKTA